MPDSALAADHPESRISIIIPVLNESASIAAILSSLQPLRARGAEIIVVDGGSTDNTVLKASHLADLVLIAPRGRAAQMNVGAQHARADILLFLHADSTLPDAADRLMQTGLASSGRDWGRFNVSIAGSRRSLRLVAFMMNWRSRLTGIASGDQGIFVRRSVFKAAGAYPEIALMEDLALSTVLLRFSRPLCLKDRIETSSRRWEKGGVWRTILLMWSLRLAYFLGVDPARLERIYHGR